MDLLAPEIDNILILKTITEMLFRTLTSQAILDFSPLVEYITGDEYTVRVINNHVILYWECRNVFAALLERTTRTLYPPVKYNNETFFL